jgi:hypothetical protein
MGFCGVAVVARAAWFIERLRGIGIFRAAYVAFGSLARFWLRAGYFGSAAMGGHSRCRRPYLKSANNGPPNRIRPPGRRLLSRPYAFRKASKSALIVSACVVGNAMREALIGLQRAVPQEFCGKRPGSHCTAAAHYRPGAPAAQMLPRGARHDHTPS